MTGTSIVRFIFIRNSRSRMLYCFLYFICRIRLAVLNITPSRIITRWRWSTFLSCFFLPFWYLFFSILSCVEKLDVLDDADVPSDEFVDFWPFYTDPAASWATYSSHREDCAGGMYLDSRRLHHRALCAYPSSGWYIKIRMSRKLYVWFGTWLSQLPHQTAASCNSVTIMFVVWKIR